MTPVNDDLIRAFLADEARRALAAAPSLDEAVGRLAPRIAGRPRGASQRLIVLLAATLLLVAALGTAIVVGSGLLRLPLVIDDPTISDTMWPQSSLDEVREAQERADAGDAAYAWQVDPQLSSEDGWGYLIEPGPEIIERFLRERLGWDQFLFNVVQGDDFDGAADGVYSGLVYLRCAPGETNPLYSNIPDQPLGAASCAPTIDDLHYETVRLNLAQLDQRGLTGIWVVSRWATTAPFAQTDAHVAETEVTARLEEFLAARIAGEGAEGLVKVGGDEGMAALDEVPLLYATTTGAPYERFEIERVSGPHWPYAEMEFTIRLFADGDVTVVEQEIAWTFGGSGRLELRSNVRETTENGQPVGVPYEFFDGEVTASATAPWEVSPLFDVALTLNGQLGDERIELVDDPLPAATGCETGPAPGDANALAASIQADPDLEATAPVAESVGGTAAVRMDVVAAPEASVCDAIPATLVLRQNDHDWRGFALAQGSRMRLYLVDLPEGSETRILAIAIQAPAARFEDVIEAATPVLDSVEFHAP